jgi:uncharacterized membrane protein YfcA
MDILLLRITNIMLSSIIYYNVLRTIFPAIYKNSFYGILIGCILADVTMSKLLATSPPSLRYFFYKILIAIAVYFLAKKRSRRTKIAE